MERGRTACGGLFERPFVSWRNDVALFMGPRLAGYSAVDVEDQTEVEIRSHRLMAQHLAVYREHAPGFAGAYLMLSAPQLGVRHARRLVGVGRVTREDWPDGAPRLDEVGISPSLQRGTSRREDVLDTVLGLRRPSDYTPDQGARFEVVFEKARGLYGDDAQAYEERDGAVVWARTEIADSDLLRVADVLRDGLSIRETAQELGISRSKVDRLKKRADAKGLLSGREAADD